MPESTTVQSRRVAIVPHTHWDREWHQTFQTFRLALVDLVDDLLDLLEADASFSHFMLDGQTAAVDDYLEIRPEAATRLADLSAAGRLSIGPWYTLPDEFLVSGETHIRNLQLGRERAAALGGAMQVGYLPDTFGHIAQMPQILRQFGLEHSAVWRGVPRALSGRPSFTWRAPDGSSVTTEFLMRGYSEGASIEGDADTLVRRARASAADIGADGGDLLWLNGNDHQVPQPWLGRVVAEANRAQDDFEFVIGSLPAHLERRRRATSDLPVWDGELRSGFHADLLMGCASNRMDVKQHAAVAERGLERLAEPLAALFLDPARNAAAALDVAWRDVIRNAAHDSICACSIDAVVDAVLDRYRGASDIADGVVARATSSLLSSLRDAGHVVINPSSRPRSGVVEITVPDASAFPGGQLVERQGGGRIPIGELPPEMLRSVLVFGGEEIAPSLFLNGIEFDGATDPPEVTFQLGRRRLGTPFDPAALGAAYDSLAEGRHGSYRLCAAVPAADRLAVRVHDVPGYGWSQLSDGASDDGTPVQADRTTLRNGLVTVEVDPTTGTWSLDGHAGLGRLVDDGDAGDTYNWCPPRIPTVVDTPSHTEIELVEDGPVRGAVRIRRTFDLPERIDDRLGERVGVVATTVDTTISLHAGERFVRVTESWVNASRDHRLRVVFPLPAAAETSEAECAFAIVERTREAEGGRSERPVPTFPSRRFVRAGGLTVAHEGLPEYELIDDGRALALTLLRCVGWLSRDVLETRTVTAGPTLQVHGAQMLGPRHARYCVATADVDPYAMVDDAFLPLLIGEADGGGGRTPQGSALTVRGGEVSSLRRTRDGDLELRLFNPTPEPTCVDLGGRRGSLVDLTGTTVGSVDGSVELRPWGIATVQLED